MRNLTSEFFLYFSKFHVHDEKNYFPLSLPSSKFLKIAITTNLSPLQHIFAECFLVQSVFPFWSSSSSFFSQIQTARHELRLWYRLSVKVGLQVNHWVFCYTASISNTSSISLSFNHYTSYKKCNWRQIQSGVSHITPLLQLIFEIICENVFRNIPL